MIEILTIINSILILWLIFKSFSKQKVFSTRDIDIVGQEKTKVIGNKHITKIYPNLEPINILDKNDIANEDIKNLLMSLKDEQNWKLSSFSISDDKKDPMHFIRIFSNIPQTKSIELSAIFREGKLCSLEMQRPIYSFIVTPSWKSSPTTDENIISQFTIAMWPFYKKGSEEYNDDMAKMPSAISKCILDVVPKDEIRDQKLNDILSK